MRVREQQVNDALRVLDEMHRLQRIDRDKYRRRRRQLLDSLRDAGAGTGRDTVRRVVPAGDTLQVAGRTTVQRHDAGRAASAPPPDRRMGWRWAVVCVLLLAMLAGAVAVCWFVMTA